jgi:hypothetical protein
MKFNGKNKSNKVLDLGIGNNVEIFNPTDIYIGPRNKYGPNGYGKMTYANGDVYEGQWKNGLKQGSGVMDFSNGDKYEGQWKNGKMHGKGVMKFSYGQKYEGEWKEGLMDGLGEFTYNYDTEYNYIKSGVWENGQEISNKTFGALRKSVSSKNIKPTLTGMTTIKLLTEPRI